MIRVSPALVHPFLFGFLVLGTGCGPGDAATRDTTASGGSSSGGSGGGTGGAVASGGSSTGGAATGGSGQGGASAGSTASGGSNSAGSSGTGNAGTGNAGTGPMGDPITDLPVGTWTDVTPEGSLGSTGVYHMGVAPGQPEIVYVSSDKQGMYKSTDASKTWVRLGNPDGTHDANGTEYLEDPCSIEVDPNDPEHVYATEGVDGGRNGFWVSTNGGDTWSFPQGFKDVGAIVGGAYSDVVEMSVDPADFNRVIFAPHSDWNITAGYSSGIYSSTDGGVTFDYHLPPGDAWAAGSKGVHILHHPESNTGNGDTWLVCDEGAGFWRTTNAGDTWTQVAAQAQGPHGGNQGFYTPEGVLYMAAVYHPWRSTDNGASWESLDSTPSTGYHSIFGASGYLFAHHDGSDAAAFQISAFDDGDTWMSDEAEHGLTQGGTWEMQWDPINKILYSVNKSGGLWALRTEQ